MYHTALFHLRMARAAFTFSSLVPHLFAIFLLNVPQVYLFTSPARPLPREKFLIPGSLFCPPRPEFARARAPLGSASRRVASPTAGFFPRPFYIELLLLLDLVSHCVCICSCAPDASAPCPTSSQKIKR